jgi:uncharacterized membrane-anchored protein YitT (DUF2179 family)
MNKKLVSYAMVVLIALMMALNYTLFVFPNSFAPAGLNGIFTMIQHALHFKLSYTSIILNVPLAILVFFVIAKPFAARSLVYTLAFSAFLMVFEKVDLSAFVYKTEISALVGPAVAGMITGFGGYYMHRIGACYGGTEFIAKLIHKKNPAVNFFSIIFALNVAVAAASYFVYDFQIQPVLMCIIYSYFSSSVRDNMNRKHQSALRCEIVTNRPEELSKQIITQLRHGVTASVARGMYTGEEKAVLVCILNSSQLTELTKIVSEFPGSFVTVSDVNTVLGNFKHLDSHNQPERQLFDTGKTPSK